MTPGLIGNSNQAAIPHALPTDTQWVDTPEALEALVQRVRAVQQRNPEAFRSGLDTEADSLHHFQEKLCLIQLTYGDEFALVDPLAVPDVSSLIDVLDLGEVWFHGADYDLTLMRRTYGWTPKVLRDTQIAARLSGSRQFGLAALIEKHFGKTISKASQKADWSKRPLSGTMLHYAVEDVRYLFQLGDIFQEQLRAKNRMSWFVESCEDLCAEVARRSSLPKEDPWRVQGTGKLHPQGLAFVRDIWQWREKIAEERDVPCFRIISNKQLLDHAAFLEQGRRPVPPAGWRPRWKRDFDDIVEAVLTGTEADWPQRIRQHGGRLSDKARDQLDMLCQHRERIALGLDIEPSLLGARSTLEGVVLKEDGMQELLAWQMELMSEPLTTARQALGFVRSEANA